MKNKVSFQESQSRSGTTPLIHFSLSKSSSVVYNWDRQPTNQINGFGKFEDLVIYESKVYDESFNSHEIYIETEAAEDQFSNNSPKIADFNKNNLKLKRDFTKIEYKVKSSNFEAYLLIAKYYFSVGILALPYLFHLTGFVLGALLITFTAVMTIYSVKLIIEINEDMQSNLESHLIKSTTSISELGFKIFGNPGLITCRIFSAIANLGSCLSYIIFFEIYVSSFIQEQWSHKISDDQAHLIGALFAFTIILPLSAVNNISVFWKTNLISFIFGLTSVLFMLYLDFSLILGIGGIQRSDNDLWKTDNIFIAIGIAVYSFQIMGIALNVNNCMEEPKKFIPVFTWTTIQTCILYLSFGIITQLALGEYVQDIVLLNFAPLTFTGFIVRILYIISILLSYPLKFYIVVSIYENLKCFKEQIFCTEQYNAQVQTNSYQQQIALIKRYAIRYCLIVFIFMLSLTTYKLAKMISLVGSLGSIFLQFVIPQVLYMKYFNVSWCRIVFGVFICFIFITSAAFGVYRSIQGLFNLN